MASVSTVAVWRPSENLASHRGFDPWVADPKYWRCLMVFGHCINWSNGAGSVQFSLSSWMVSDVKGAEPSTSSFSRSARDTEQDVRGLCFGSDSLGCVERGEALYRGIWTIAGPFDIQFSEG